MQACLLVLLMAAQTRRSKKNAEKTQLFIGMSSYYIQSIKEKLRSFNRKIKHVFCTFYSMCWFFLPRFPHNDPQLLRKWVINMRRDKWKPTARSLLCSKHFTENYFDRTGKTVRLRKTALTTVFSFPEHLQSKVNYLSVKQPISGNSFAFSFCMICMICFLDKIFLINWAMFECCSWFYELTPPRVNIWISHPVAYLEAPCIPFWVVHLPISNLSRLKIMENTTVKNGTYQVTMS